MATKRGEKRRIDDNERFSKCSTEGSEAEKRVRISDDSVDVNKKTIEKLLRTNSQIISKLEVLITGQKNLETRLSSIEKKLNDNNKNNNNTIDPEVKDVMYSVFEVTGHKLPSTNTQASPSKIQKWKNKAEVKRCYNNLFKKVKDGQPTTYTVTPLYSEPRYSE
ncbi:hypothetical protein GLOIN_2v1591384 [Rhizophagus irregularis DAOM 181602=DAOM 197198]|nr:hypothetical protein GLOIN_2v1591384 [Rhizophagus irregularis DAOM 181602=DAOM 197198]